MSEEQTEEFGCQSTVEYAKGTGRDQNAYGFTMWMAGGGIKSGVSYGEIDEFGSAVVMNRLHVKTCMRQSLTGWGLNPIT